MCPTSSTEQDPKLAGAATGCWVLAWSGPARTAGGGTGVTRGPNSATEACTALKISWMGFSSGLKLLSIGLYDFAICL